MNNPALQTQAGQAGRVGLKHGAQLSVTVQQTYLLNFLHHPHSSGIRHEPTADAEAIWVIVHLNSKHHFHILIAPAPACNFQLWMCTQQLNFVCFAEALQ